MTKKEIPEHFYDLEGEWFGKVQDILYSDWNGKILVITPTSIEGEEYDETRLSVYVDSRGYIEDFEIG